MNQNDLYIEYARIIKMCKGTALEDKPWLGVRENTGENEAYIFDEHPYFNSDPENYQFAIAILEGSPVFVGDSLYHPSGAKWIVGDTDDLTGMSWQPPKPKRTFELRGMELPCPTNQISKYDLHALTINSACFWFETQEEKDLVEDTLLNILTEARDKP